MAGNHTIDAVLYQHLVTGNFDDFNESILVRQLDVLKLRNARDKNNVLHIAAIFGHVHIVNQILSQWPKLMVQKNCQGDLPVHSALKTGKLESVKAFTSWLQQGRANTADQVLGWHANGRNTALHIALELYECEHEMARHLVDLYPRACYSMNKEEICPLYLAIKKEFVGLVRHMLARLGPLRQHVLACLRKGKSVLHAAVSAKGNEILEDMLSFDGVDLIKSVDKQGWTALSYAAYTGYVEVVQVFLNKVPHCAFISNKDNSFPIHLAVQGGHISVISLLSSSRFLLNARGQNILHVAVLAADFAMVCRLLDLLDDNVELVIDQKDDDGNTPLHLSKKLTLLPEQGNDKVQRLIISALERASRGLKSFPIDDNVYSLLVCGNLNQVLRIVSQRNFDLKDLECLEDGCSVLHIAASIGQPLLVVDLLRRNCDALVYLANNKGDLPIHSAAKAGNFQSLKALLEWPNITVDWMCKCRDAEGNTALHIALLNNHPKMAKYLYEQCPEAAYCLNKDNICPLFLAIRNSDDHSVVDDMIDGLEGNTQFQTDLQGAKSIVHMAIFTRRVAILNSIMTKAPGLMDSLDSKGRNPLSYAAHIGYVEGVVLLLRRLPNMEFRRDKDDDRSFPIHHATKGGQVKVIKLLHPKICLLNGKNQNILHVAAETGQANVVGFLLGLQEFKELLNTGDDNGNTPLHLAVKSGHYKTVYQLTTLREYFDGNSTNHELLTPRDMYEMHLQDPCQKVPRKKEVKLMDMLLQRVDGKKSILIHRCEDQENYRKENDIKQAKPTQDKISPSLDAKLSVTNRERANIFLVVATLIISVGFAAAFAPPGGYKEGTGIPNLISSPAFRVFMISNGFAVLFAVGSAVTLILGMNVQSLTDITLYIGGFHILLGMLSMTVAFLAGSIDVQLFSLLKPGEMKWRWLIIRRIVQILMMPVLPVLFFYCRKKFECLTKLHIQCLLKSCSVERSNLDFTI